jgi:hypothetical protein
MPRHQNPVCPSPSVTILRLYISWQKLASFDRSQIWLIPSLRCAFPRNCVNPILFIYYLLLADKPTFRFRNAPLNTGFQSLCYRYSTTKYVVKFDKATGQFDWEISVTRTVQILCKLSRKDIGWQSSLKRRLERLLVKVKKIFQWEIWNRAIKYTVKQNKTKGNNCDNHNYSRSVIKE